MLFGFTKDDTPIPITHFSGGHPGDMNDAFFLRPGTVAFVGSPHFPQVLLWPTPSATRAFGGVGIGDDIRDAGKDLKRDARHALRWLSPVERYRRTLQNMECRCMSQLLYGMG